MMLLKMMIFSSGRKLRYSLARELVVTLSAAILGLLLVYMVNDLLGQQLAQISENLRQYAAGVMLVGWACLTGWNATKQMVEIWSGHMTRWLFATGEKPGQIVVYNCLRSVLVLALWSIVMISAEHFLLQTRSRAFYGLACVGAIVSGLISQWVYRWRVSAMNPVWEIVFKATSKPKMMLHWRLFQVFVRNRITRMILIITAIFVQLYLAVQDAPFPILMLVAFVCGWVLAQTLAFQAQDDMEFSWCEQQLGISHTEFVDTYVRLASLLGFSLGLFLWLVYVVFHPVQVLIDHWTLIESAKLLAAAYVAPFMMPFLLFQIDVRKPYIQAVASLMLGLIGMTAIYAHWSGIALLPLFRYYAVTAQADRYYRA